MVLDFIKINLNLKISLVLKKMIYVIIMKKLMKRIIYNKAVLLNMK